jgi:hypothetical protein
VRVGIPLLPHVFDVAQDVDRIQKETRALYCRHGVATDECVADRLLAGSPATHRAVSPFKGRGYREPCERFRSMEAATCGVVKAG